MKKLVNIVVVLTVIGIISGGILALAYRQMSPLIKEKQRKAAQQAVFAVVPQAASIKNIKTAEQEYFEAYDVGGNLAGYALICKGNGYQGKIKMIVGITTDLSKFTGMKVLEQVETPGLGAKIANLDFEKQFQALNIQSPLQLVKNQVPEKEKNQVQAITGATISSRAVINIINKGINTWLKSR